MTMPKQAHFELVHDLLMQLWSESMNGKHEDAERTYQVLLETVEDFGAHFATCSDGSCVMNRGK
jgi:hypothetical protein